MTGEVDAFRVDYAAALRRYLATGTESTLTVGHELGRRALVEGISLLDLTENHFRVMAENPGSTEAALQFLLQTLTALDVATRGFLGGTKRYAQQRARADLLAERDAFRRALVDSLQDGFFVANDRGRVVEINTAFGDITGYGADGLPYGWPHPWIPPDDPLRDEHEENLPDRLRACGGRFTLCIRHRDGGEVWLAVTTSMVSMEQDGERIYVGTIRDVTKERAAAAREQEDARLATALSAATTVVEVFAAGLGVARSSLGATAAVAVIWPEAGAPPLVYPHGAIAAAEWSQLDPGARLALERARVLPESIVESIPAAPAARGLAAGLGVGIDGALWLEYPESRRTTTNDTAITVALVAKLNLALQRARNYDQARTASLTLQRAMLGATALPPRFAVRYEPAVPPLEIGGDWYDVVPLADQRYGVIVGDCVGRGLAAAAVMGQLRSSARALLSTGASPGRVLDQLDVVAATIPGASCTTVFAAVLDAARGELRYTCAGHVPALVALPGESEDESDAVESLEGKARALPLATFDCSPRPEETLLLPPGSTLVLFTDGLVERRAVSIDTGLDAVATMLADARGRTPDQVAEYVLSERRPAVGYDDDVAMVVYRQPPAPLRLDEPADAPRLAEIRRRLRTWLTAAGMADRRANDLVMAVNEACTNSIEHGYRDSRAGRVTVRAVAEALRIAVTVSDAGSWLPNSESGSGVHRGRGIEIMRAMCDSLAMDCTPDGTTVRLTSNL
jgi:PAS domain S-box-containing protein